MRKFNVEKKIISVQRNDTGWIPRQRSARLAQHGAERRELQVCYFGSSCFHWKLKWGTFPNPDSPRSPSCGVSSRFAVFVFNFVNFSQKLADRMNALQAPA